MKFTQGRAIVRLTPTYVRGAFFIQGQAADNSNANDFTSHVQGFAAVQYLFAGQLFVKAEVAIARAYFQPSDLSVAAWTNTMYNGRVRLMYVF